MTRFLGAVLMLTFSQWALADTLLMDNGDRLTGKLDSIANGVAIFDTNYAGTLRIALTHIRELRTDEEYTVHFDQREVRGSFVSQDSMQQLKYDHGSEVIRLAEVRIASQSRHLLTAFTEELKSRIDIALSTSTGNSPTDSSNLALEVNYKDKLNAHLFTATLAREEGDGTVTQDQLNVDYGYKRFVSDRWFGSVNAGYYHDTLKDIDSRTSLGAGVGMQFIDNSFRSLSSDIGLGVVEGDVNGNDSGGLEPAARWGLSYQQYLFAKTLELFHRQSVLQLLEGKKSQVFSSSSGVRYALNKRIDTGFRIDVAYESDPPLGNQETDVTYSLGVGLKF